MDDDRKALGSWCGVIRTGTMIRYMRLGNYSTATCTELDLVLSPNTINLGKSTLYIGAVNFMLYSTVQ